MALKINTPLKPLLHISCGNNSSSSSSSSLYTSTTGHRHSPSLNKQTGPATSASNVPSYLRVMCVRVRVCACVCSQELKIAQRAIERAILGVSLRDHIKSAPERKSPIYLKESPEGPWCYILLVGGSVGVKCFIKTSRKNKKQSLAWEEQETRTSSRISQDEDCGYKYRSYISEIFIINSICLLLQYKSTWGINITPLIKVFFIGDLLQLFYAKCETGCHVFSMSIPFPRRQRVYTRVRNLAALTINNASSMTSLPVPFVSGVWTVVMLSLCMWRRIKLNDESGKVRTLHWYGWRS